MIIIQVLSCSTGWTLKPRSSGATLKPGMPLWPKPSGKVAQAARRTAAGAGAGAAELTEEAGQEVHQAAATRTGVRHAEIAV